MSDSNLNLTISPLGDRVTIACERLVYDSREREFRHSLLDVEVTTVRAAILTAIDAARASLAPGATADHNLRRAREAIAALRSREEAAEENRVADEKRQARILSLRGPLLAKVRERAEKGYLDLIEPFFANNEYVNSATAREVWETVPAPEREVFEERARVVRAEHQAQLEAERKQTIELETRAKAEREAAEERGRIEVRVLLVHASADDGVLERYDAGMLPTTERDRILGGHWFAALGAGDPAEPRDIDHDEDCADDSETTDHRSDASVASAEEWARLKSLRSSAPSDATVTLREVYDSCDSCGGTSPTRRYVRVRIARAGVIIARCYRA